ncbi:MAG: sulfatase-like hydrolase/transferase [Clostridia bacterium]|nr:sulfatase-like hydrolase/transferase [Clostridia bacterium]
MKRPNILWLCTDQQRFDTLGCCGNRFVQTPNLDRLAENGVLFSRAYCQNPVCTPSRASFLTGRYPRTCRTRQNGQDIPADEIPVTRILHENGYLGGLPGKLHLSACHCSVCQTRERRIDDGYDSFAWSHGHGPAHEWQMHDYALWLKQQGVTYAHPPRPDCRYVRTGMPAEYHQTKWCADRAIEFMEAAKKAGKPWFFSLNWFDPHHAFDPPAEYLERYLPFLSEIPLPEYRPGELENKSPLQRRDHLGAYGKAGSFAFDDMTEYDHRLIRAAYYAMIDLIDVQTGRLIDYLRNTDQLDDTIILFHSDHGESLGDHGLYLKGGYFYEASVHVPLILSWKNGFISGVRSDAPVELVDLAPTLLEACGIEKAPGMQGRSLYGILTGAAPADVFRDTVYSEYYKTDAAGGVTAFCTMISDGRLKLTKIHALAPDLPCDCPGELYDLASDPGEHINLYNDPRYTGEKLRLLEALCDRQALTADPLPVARAPW